MTVERLVDDCPCEAGPDDEVAVEGEVRGIRGIVIDGRYRETSRQVPAKEANDSEAGELSMHGPLSLDSSYTPRTDMGIASRSRGTFASRSLSSDLCRSITPQSVGSVLNILDEEKVSQVDLTVIL